MTAPSSIELTLRFEAGQWRAAGADLDVSHADLAELDSLIVQAFAAEPHRRRVHVRFDTRALPTWMRQYQAHYFNYVLEVGRGARA